MFMISKEFSFSASHQLAALREGHPCARLHGHNYLVVFELAALPDELNEAGFVRDFGDLDIVKKWIDETLDHRHLNDVLKNSQPSAENLARWIFESWNERIPELISVRVSETSKTWASYTPTTLPVK